MAIWQWDILVVPERKIKKVFSSIPKKIDEQIFESIKWWHCEHTKTIISFLNQILPSYKDSLTDYVKQWGSEDGNRIDLIFEENRITDFLVRIDLRNIDKEFLSSLITFAKQNEFLFFSCESSKIISPTNSELIGAIYQSRKNKYFSNPEDFFRDQKYFNQIKKKNDDKANKILKD